MRKLSLVIEFDAWATGEHRKDIKNPKYHFVDSGILCALRRFTDQSFEIGGSPTALGSVLESYVANEILRFLPFLDWTLRAHHWRSSNYREIDMIIERETALVGIEIKASTQLRDDVIDNLRWFGTQSPRRKRQ